MLTDKWEFGVICSISCAGVMYSLLSILNISRPPPVSSQGYTQGALWNFAASRWMYVAGLRDGILVTDHYLSLPSFAILIVLLLSVLVVCGLPRLYSKRLSLLLASRPFGAPLVATKNSHSISCRVQLPSDRQTGALFTSWT
jgi:hypothetical protein